MKAFKIRFDSPYDFNLIKKALKLAWPKVKIKIIKPKDSWYMGIVYPLGIKQSGKIDKTRPAKDLLGGSFVIVDLKIRGDEYHVLVSPELSAFKIASLKKYTPNL